MLPDREGRFQATIGDHGVAETGSNKLATFVCQYRLRSELVNGEWLDVAGENMEITGYHYLEKKDGAINQTTIDMLKGAFSWDGRDPFWLQDADMSGLLVQLKLGFEEYEGKERIKVKFVDPMDSNAGNVPKADDSARRSINTRLGSKFRALAGGSPVQAPKPTASKPATTRKAPAKRAAVVTEATMESAWAEFIKHCVDREGNPRSQQDTEAEWFAVLEELSPGKEPGELSSADWARMIAEGPSHITPF